MTMQQRFAVEILITGSRLKGVIWLYLTLLFLMLVYGYSFAISSLAGIPVSATGSPSTSTQATI